MKNNGPVPAGMSPALEGAMIVPWHAAEQDEQEMTWTELASQAVSQSADWPGGEAPDLSGEEPPQWLDDDYHDPEDPSFEDWDYLALAAQAEADGIADRERRLRLLGNDVGTGYAHQRGEAPLPGPHAGPGRHFGQGMVLDSAPAAPALAVAAEEAAGPARDFPGVDDDALLGVLGARRRLVARQDWERLMTIAEIIRRRPAAGCRLQGPGRMPRVWLEGAAREISAALAITNHEAVTLLGLAADLVTRLPLTSDALRDGILDLDKARLIGSRLAGLTDDEAREAEALFFATPGVEDMTWGKVAYWILNAAMTVNPDAAVRHRKQGARDGRVVLKQQGSGNYSLAGYELPAVAALAMDKAITARARELKRAGVTGSIQRLRMLAYLEAWNSEDPFTSTHGIDDDREDDPEYADGDLGEDGLPADWPQGPPADNTEPEAEDCPEPQDGKGSRDHVGSADGSQDRDGSQDDDADGQDGNGPEGGSGGGGVGGPQPGPAGTGNGGGCTCGHGHPGQGRTGASPALPGWLNLTAPLATMQRQAERPGALHGAGAMDPEQTRDLADAILRDDRSTICITTVDPDGRPAAHACGKPGPGDRTRRRRGRDPSQGLQGTLDDRSPPGDTAALTQIDTGPPGSLGTWQLTIADRELIFTFETLAGPCDHKHQTAAHDPGKLLKHLTTVLNQECTFLTCRSPDRSCDYEHSTPHDKGGITCLCACGPVCRRNHLDKQQPRWRIDPGSARGWFIWTLPSGRTYTKGPTIYPA
jgi:hypothetical protein